MNDRLVTAWVSMGPDGDLYINEGDNDEGNLLAHLSAIVVSALGLFDESRFGFSYEGDSERCVILLEWLLADGGYSFRNDRGDIHRNMTNLCSPGGFMTEPVGFTITLVNENVPEFTVNHVINRLNNEPLPEQQLASQLLQLGMSADVAEKLTNEALSRNLIRWVPYRGYCAGGRPS